MKSKKIIAALAALCLAGFVQASSAQTNPTGGAPASSPGIVRKAQSDTIRKYQRTETVSRKPHQPSAAEDDRVNNTLQQGTTQTPSRA